MGDATSVDELGAFFKDIARELNILGGQKVTVSTPEYFAASVEQSIPENNMLNLGAYVMLTVVACVRNETLPQDVDDDTKREITSILDKFYDESMRRGEYAHSFSQYGLVVEKGDNFVFSIARRTDILQIGKKITVSHNLPVGSLGIRMANIYNNFIGSEIASVRESPRSYMV
jgi:hypothetical protein